MRSARHGQPNRLWRAQWLACGNEQDDKRRWHSRPARLGRTITEGAHKRALERIILKRWIINKHVTADEASRREPAPYGKTDLERPPPTGSCQAPSHAKTSPTPSAHASDAGGTKRAPPRRADIIGGPVCRGRGHTPTQAARTHLGRKTREEVSPACRHETEKPWFSRAFLTRPRGPRSNYRGSKSSSTTCSIRWGGLGGQRRCGTLAASKPMAHRGR
jgi:hypothetical protein